jgi:hypothetical protein
VVRGLSRRFGGGYPSCSALAAEPLDGLAKRFVDTLVRLDAFVDVLLELDLT